jgi:deoxyribodipyrimidine photolyase-related protein
MIRHLRFVFGDQLTRSLSALRDIDPLQDMVVMIEASNEARNVPHHKQKIALVLSAMRHFAASLRAEGLRVDYVPMDATDNLQDLGRELAKAVQRHSPTTVIATEPSEWRAMQLMQAWDLGAPLEVREDDRFFCTRADFAALTKAKKTGRMEYFYREMRRRTGLLMRGDGPEGGQWNFDTENRKALPDGLRPPPRTRFAPDQITTEVVSLVATRFASHFGDLTPFGWAVTRDDALMALDHFIIHCLPSFGTRQVSTRGIVGSTRFSGRLTQTTPTPRSRTLDAVPNTDPLLAAKGWSASSAAETTSTPFWRISSPRCWTKRSRSTRLRGWRQAFFLSQTS